MDTGKSNQNLWALLISFGFLGLSEYYKLPLLGKFALAASAATIVSYLITLIPYTRRYCIDKWKGKEQREQRDHRDRGPRPQHPRGNNPPRQQGPN